MENLSSVNRFEVIDHTDEKGGRDYVKWVKKSFNVQYDLQDDGRTLKIFLTKDSKQYGNT